MATHARPILHSPARRDAAADRTRPTAPTAPTTPTVPLGARPASNATWAALAWSTPPTQPVVPTGGQPLPAGTAASFGRSLGHDVRDVRVHADADADRLARRFEADAYTVGRDIVFAQGKYAPGAAGGRRLLAHELTHVVQQAAGPVDGHVAPGDVRVSRPSDPLEREAERVADAVHTGRPVAAPLVAPRATPAASIVLSRQPTGGAAPPAPTPPAWLGSWGAGAKPVQGDVWDVRLPSLGGDVWVGPYDELQAYIRAQGFAGRMEAAHILGGEHLGDIASAVPYNKAPCVAVDKSLHAKWSGQTTTLQARYLGGRTTATAGRPEVARAEVVELYDEVYSAHPELREMVRKIVSPSYTSPMPAPTSPMSAYRGSPMPRPSGSPMDAFSGSSMPKPASPMDAYRGSPVMRPATPMDEYRLAPRATPQPTPAARVEPGAGVGVEAGAGVGAGVARLAVDAVRGLLIVAVVMEGLRLAYLWISYEKNVESAEEAALKKLFADKVSPGVERELTAHAAEAEAMTNDMPELPVYANVTIELDESWDATGIAGSESERRIVDARFIDLGVSFTQLRPTETAVRDESFTVPLSDVTSHLATKRVQYSVVIDFGETPAQHKSRMFRHEVAEAVSRGLSARAVAGHSHFGGDPLSAADEREERRRAKWHEISLRDEREREDRTAWVRAYVEYTAFAGPDDLYLDAIAYLKELEATPTPQWWDE